MPSTLKVATTINDACYARMTRLLNLSEFLLLGCPETVENSPLANGATVASVYPSVTLN